MERTVEVVMLVHVKTDDSKFTEQFMEEFRESFYPFFDMADHAKHIAQLAAREIYDFSRYLPKEFVEGYGPIGEFGIEAAVIDTRMEVLETLPDAPEGGA